MSRHALELACKLLDNLICRASRMAHACSRVKAGVFAVPLPSHSELFKKILVVASLLFLGATPFKTPLPQIVNDTKSLVVERVDEDEARVPPNSTQHFPGRCIRASRSAVMDRTVFVIRIRWLRLGLFHGYDLRQISRIPPPTSFLTRRGRIWRKTGVFGSEASITI